MKKFYFLLFILCSLIFITGCTDIDHEENVETIDFEGQAQDTVGVGNSCKTKRCNVGLECDINFVCVDHVVDHNMVCPETQKPVCGYRDGRKNGYLNKCEAQRHGAEFLYDGFCKPDESVAGNCEAPLTSIGNCNEIYEGYEFSNGSCVKKSVGGCDAEIPFATLEECEQSCK